MGLPTFAPQHHPGIGRVFLLVGCSFRCMPEPLADGTRKWVNLNSSGLNRSLSPGTNTLYADGSTSWVVLTRSRSRRAFRSEMRWARCDILMRWDLCQSITHSPQASLRLPVPFLLTVWVYPVRRLVDLLRVEKTKSVEVQRRGPNALRTILDIPNQRTTTRLCAFDLARKMGLELDNLDHPSAQSSKWKWWPVPTRTPHRRSGDSHRGPITATTSGGRIVGMQSGRDQRSECWSQGCKCIFMLVLAYILLGC